MDNLKELDVNDPDIVDNSPMTTLELETAATGLMELFNDRFANSAMNKAGVEINPGNYKYKHTEEIDKKKVDWEIVAQKGTDVGNIIIHRLTTEAPQTDGKINNKRTEETVFIQAGKNPLCMYETKNNFGLTQRSLPQNTRFAFNKSRELIKAIPQIRNQKAPSR